MEIAKDTKIPFVIVVNNYDVSYKDEKGNIRTKFIKENDEGYREIENKPVIGLKVKGHNGGHYSRWEYYSRISKEYVEILDPRGFYVNISVPNFLYIVANSTIENGIIKDEMIWSWNRGNVLLMPTNTDDYKEVLDYSKLLNKDKKYSVKDLVIGKKYLLKGNKEVYYLGRHQYYRTTNNIICKSGYKWNGGYSDLYETKKTTAHYVIDASIIDGGIASINRSHYYVNLLTTSNVIDEFDQFITDEQLKECVKLIYSHKRYNPIDYINVKEYIPLPFGRFVEELNTEKDKLNLKQSYHYRMTNFYVENESGLCNSYVKLSKNPNGDNFRIDVDIILRTENDKMAPNYNMFSRRHSGSKNIHSSCFFVDNLGEVDGIYEELYNLIKPVILVYSSEDGRNVEKVYKR